MELRIIQGLFVCSVSNYCEINQFRDAMFLLSIQIHLYVQISLSAETGVFKQKEQYRKFDM